MKVLLVKSIHHLCEDCCSGIRTYVFSSLIFQTAWFLKRNEMDVDIVDLRFKQAVDYRKYDVIVGFVPLISGFYQGIEILQEAKKVGATTIMLLQSFLGVFEPEIMHDFHEIDYAILMEDRELTLLDLLKYLSSPKKIVFPSNGIAFRDVSGKIVVTPKRKAVDELNHMVSAVEMYKKAKLSSYIRTHVTVGRGCPYSCSFCAMRLTRPRKRPIDAVVEELLFLSNYMHSFELVDPDIMNKPDWIAGLAEEIVRQKIKISWIADTRAEALKDIPLLKLLRRAGCYRLAIGVESLASESTDHIGKGNTLQDIELAAENCRQAGIIPNFNYMVGFWWDSHHTLQMVEDFFKKYPNNYAFVQIVRPYKSTPIYNQFLEKGLIKETTYKDYINSTEEPIAPTLYLSKEEVFEKYKRLKVLGNNAPLLADIKDLGLKGVVRTISAEGFFNVGKKIIGRVCTN